MERKPIFDALAIAMPSKSFGGASTIGEPMLSPIMILAVCRQDEAS